MSSRQIIATRKSSPDHGHGHIISVLIRGSQVPWSVATVRHNIMAGADKFYTFGYQSKMIAYVEPFTCCGVETIRSESDSVTDNNLDNLPPF
jgi:hypothetical protein